MNCQYCNKECKNNNSKTQHELLCIHNEYSLKYRLRLKEIRTKIDYKPWNKGLTKEIDIRLKNTSELNKLNPVFKIGHTHTEETKKLLSQKMYERYKNGWNSTAGRCKKYDYISPNAGIIKVDGTWELKTAIYLDSLNIKWLRNKKRFLYFNELKNKNSTYCPDFYIVDSDTYIEVKGYKTDLDYIKWKQFEHKLEIWDKKKLISLGIEI